MTRRRYDDKSTEFGLWLRQQKELDSQTKHFICSNIDYLWLNYKTGDWMLIEEKRYKRDISFAQKGIFKTLHNAIKDSKYKGFYLIQFEKTSPDDGQIFLNNVEISKEELIEFLQFKRTNGGKR